MARSRFVKIAALFSLFLLIQHSSIAQSDKNKRSVKSGATQDKSLITKVDSLSEKLSNTLEEIRKLKRQNLELSEKLEEFRSVTKADPSSSNTNSISLIQIISLAVVLIMAVSGASLYLLGKRRRLRQHRAYSPQTSNYEISHRLDGLYSRFTRIEDKQRQIDETLKLIESELQHIRVPFATQSRVALTPPTEMFETSLSKPTTIESLPIQELISSYNAALRNENDRSSFRNAFRMSRIRVQNAMERRTDSNLKPVFQSASDGDYYAIDLRAQSSNKFAVVPRFDLTLQELNYGPGAIGLVFRCLGFDSNLRYRSFALIRPAYFTHSTGETWNLVDPGELQVGEGE
ncbi:MAG: hypothetical protein V1799_18775 [bacterium]